MKRHAAPIVAIVLLLLLPPSAYVGVFYGTVRRKDIMDYCERYDGAKQLRVILWPLERIDRKLQPSAWPIEFDL